MGIKRLWLKPQTIKTGLESSAGISPEVLIRENIML